MVFWVVMQSLCTDWNVYDIDKSEQAKYYCTEHIEVTVIMVFPSNSLSKH